MESKIVRRALTKTAFDSKAVGPLEHVIVTLEKEGFYELESFDHEGLRVREMTLEVSASATDTQIDVDLGMPIGTDSHGGCSCQGASMIQTLKPGGSLVLFTHADSGEYWAQLTRVEGDRRELMMDTRRGMPMGALYAMLPIGLGEYRIALEGTNHVASLRVDTDMKRSAVNEAVMVTVTSDGFQPNTLRAGPSQPVVFAMKSPGTIVGSLSPSQEPGPRRPKPQLPELIRDRVKRDRMRGGDGPRNP